ncbi:MAG: radical SAM family heme chaperone HemW [Candidatus Margulisbacteria bacterium]|nr:radical SAM family heme chaperone HemW [Candidatus Margulisiibacteriota bacterium]
MGIALYIHIPFCTRKCGYCSFFSISHNFELENKYCTSLVQEIRGYEAQNINIDTIYFGGGNPALLNPGHLKIILEVIRESFIFEQKPEITLEANVENLEEKKLDSYKKMGINRLSVGIQSFDAEKLKILGRHRTVEPYAILNKVLAEFNNVSLDLIYAIPSQTAEDVAADINSIPEQVKHVSYYSLMLEKGTELYSRYKKGTIKLLSENEELKMQQTIIKELKIRKLSRYEISNFALKGYESRHNLHYWRYDEYLGVGAGAVSTLNHTRLENVRDIQKYINGQRLLKKYKLNTKTREKEFLMMNLRLIKGFELQQYGDNFQANFKIKYKKFINKYFKYLSLSKEKLAFNSKGLNIYNLLMSELFIEV